MRYPWNLNYWKSGEWQVVNERLHDMEKANVGYNPERGALFRSLSSLSVDGVSCVLVGQDPYPQAKYATGLAFSIPKEIPVGDFQQTLQIIFKEYQADLHYPLPLCGDLSEWASRGVLLWNAVPSCTTGASLSHDWDEYSFLTKEVLGKVSERGGIVFAFLGSVAQRYIDCVDLTRNSAICVSHPSPRGNRNSRTPFIGSRLFTTINDKLTDLGQPPIDWRLSDAESNRGSSA